MSDHLTQFLSALRSAHEKNSLEYNSGTIARLAELYGRLNPSQQEEAVELIRNDDQLMVQVAGRDPIRSSRYIAEASLSTFSF